MLFSLRVLVPLWPIFFLNKKVPEVFRDFSEFLFYRFRSTSATRSVPLGLKKVVVKIKSLAHLLFFNYYVSKTNEFLRRCNHSS